MKTCQHADAGCNYPEGECAGFCLPTHSKPLAAPVCTGYGTGGDPIADDVDQDYCSMYHCPGDCGLRHI